MKNVLIAIDFNNNENSLMEIGHEIADKFHSKIWLVHIASPEPDFIPYTSGSGPLDERELRASALKKERKKIQNYAAALSKKDIEATALLIQGQTIETIMEKVEKLRIDLIIIGNNKHSFIYKLFMESVSDVIIKKANVPVLLVPLEP